MTDTRGGAGVETTLETVYADSDVFPRGYGCNHCDGTGTPRLDPDSEIGRAAADYDKRAALAASEPLP